MNMYDAIVVWEGINSILAAELRFTFVLFGRGHSVALLAKSVVTVLQFPLPYAKFASLQ